MLQTQALSKQFGTTRALDGVTLRVDPGEIYCLLGANGAGKTTLVNVFLNFVEPSEGRALVDGLDVTRDPLATKRCLAYIPEQVMLYGALSGLENLRYFAALATGRKPPRDELIALLVQARRLMQDLISHDLVEHADPLGDRHFSYQAGADLWAQVPRFDYRPLTVAEALRGNLLSLGVLVCATLAAAALAAWAVGVRKP